MSHRSSPAHTEGQSVSLPHTPVHTLLNETKYFESHVNWGGVHFFNSDVDQHTHSTHIQG